MRQLIFLPLLILTQTSGFAQTFIDIDGKKFNCDSAYTNYEMGLCSQFMRDESIKEYKATLNKIYICLDTLIDADMKDRQKILKDDPNQKFEFQTDYRKIKDMLIESNKLFEQYAKTEMNIEGEFYGQGRERVVGENMRLKQLYDSRIEELQYILKLHCN